MQRLLLLITLGAPGVTASWWRAGEPSDGATASTTSIGEDLAELVGSLAHTTRSLRGERAHAAELAGNGEALEEQLRGEKRSNELLGHYERLADRAARATDANYRRRLGAAYRAHQKKAQTLTHGLHVCLSTRSRLNSTLTATRKRLVSEQRGRALVQGSLSRMRHEAKVWRGLIANLTAKQIEEHMQERHLAAELLAANTELAAAHSDASRAAATSAAAESRAAEAATALAAAERARVRHEAQLNSTRAQLTSLSAQLTHEAKDWSEERASLVASVGTERKARSTAESHMSETETELAESRKVQASLVSSRDAARASLATVTVERNTAKVALAAAQHRLDAAKAAATTQARWLHAFKAEAAAGKRCEGRVAVANAKFEFANARGKRLEAEKAQAATELLKWKDQVASATEGSVQQIHRLSRALELTEADLRQSEATVAALNGTKAFSLKEAAEIAVQTGELSELRAQLTAAATVNTQLQQAREVMKAQSATLNASRAELLAAKNQLRDLNRTAEKVAALAASNANAASHAEAALNVAKDKEATAQRLLEEEEKKAGKAVADETSEVRRLREEVQQRSKDLAASRNASATLARELSDSKALLARVLPTAQQENSTIGHLQSTVSREASDLSAARNAEASLSREFAATKEALARESAARDADARTAAAVSKELAAAKAALAAAQRAGAARDSEAAALRESLRVANASAAGKEALQEQAAEAKALIVKDMDLLQRCRMYSKELKVELASATAQADKSLEAEVSKKYELMAQALEEARHEQEGLVSQNKALLSIVEKMRKQLEERSTASSTAGADE